MKKIIAMLLAVMMVLAMVACAAKQAETTTEAPAAAETTTETTETAEPVEETPLPRLPPTARPSSTSVFSSGSIPTPTAPLSVSPWTSMPRKSALKRA